MKKIAFSILAAVMLLTLVLGTALAVTGDITTQKLNGNAKRLNGEIAKEAMNNAWYTDRLTHYLFNLTTEQISFFEPGDRYRYSNDRGWVTFLSDSVHIRHAEEDSAETGDYMTPLAPTAEGTEFSYDNLKD